MLAWLVGKGAIRIRILRSLQLIKPITLSLKLLLELLNRLRLSAISGIGSSSRASQAKTGRLSPLVLDVGLDLLQSPLESFVHLGLLHNLPLDLRGVLAQLRPQVRLGGTLLAVPVLLAIVSRLRALVRLFQGALPVIRVLNLDSLVRRHIRSIGVKVLESHGTCTLPRRPVILKDSFVRAFLLTLQLGSHGDVLV